MASLNRSLFFLVLFLLLRLSIQESHHHFPISFPLTIASLSPKSQLFSSSLVAKTQAMRPPFYYNYHNSFKYSMALIVSLPIGTPPQTQKMVLDTGSQLSWIQCHGKIKQRLPPASAFIPSLSSSFSILPCNHPICKPRIPDFTLPTTCDQNRLCHYSYFYADGTLAEGNLVKEKITFSPSRVTPPLILGCASDSGEAEGILGMNIGRLSFASQARVPRFSYCVPVKSQGQSTANGTFYLGPNPHSRTFRYIKLLTFPDSQRMPNLDPLAYTVALTGIRFGRKKLNIPPSVFQPNGGGSGQTMIDSGTQYTFLVDAAYSKVREQVMRLAGWKLKKDYVFAGSLDMCFEGNPNEIGRLIGQIGFQFENGVEIVIDKERNLEHVGGGVHCIGIGRSESLGVASNIIGNFHQQNLWVEFDLINRRVGLGRTNCAT